MGQRKFPTQIELDKYMAKRYKGADGAMNESSDKLLRKLFQQYCKSDCINDVYIKVVTLNSMYSTYIMNPREVAKNITKTGTDIDKYIKVGDARAVELIRKAGPKTKRNSKLDIYSFATKYCYFSNPKNYQIYDKYAALLLTKYIVENKMWDEPSIKPFYKKTCRHSATSIQRDLRNDYRLFMAYIDLFMKRCGCKDRFIIDNFLWLKGQEIDQRRKNKKSS